MSTTARGTFDVDIRPGAAELDGAVGRFDVSKTFDGEVQGVSTGVMLSAGNPQAGSAGYVALEVFAGHLGGRRGGFALQQFGTMHEGAQVLHYDIAPGSGTDELVGITGSIRLETEGGQHHYELTYQLAGA